MNTKKSLSHVLLPVMALVMVAVAAAFSLAGSGANGASAAPVGQVNTNWITPKNVSLSGSYDNTSAIAASQLNGAVTIGWEQRDDPAETTNLILSASNASFDGPIDQRRTLGSAAYKESGNVKSAHDSVGNRHFIWWQQRGDCVSNYYAIVDATGNVIFNEEAPATHCAKRKSIAIAIDQRDNSAHMIFGRDNTDLAYWVRTAAGAWTVQQEIVPIPSGLRPTQVSVGITNQGVVFASATALSPGQYYDIYAAKRNAPNEWTVENISAPCCTGCVAPGPVSYSRTYLSSLAGDPNGGMRAAWVDEKCDPRQDPRSTDLYYREWKPSTGWNDQPLVRVTRNTGQAYFNSMVVDNGGKAHIVYSDDSGSGYSNFQTFYVSGSGVTFESPDVPFRAWAGQSFQKEHDVDNSPGKLHMTFNSNHDDPRKDVFYSNKGITEVGVTPTPTATPIIPTATPTPLTPPRCAGERFTDVCPQDFFYIAVINLANRGAMSGYNTMPPCENSLHIPCFKPENLLTRGQASKIVVVAAGLPENLTGAPHFTDVPSGNTFFTVIETAFNAGILGGYPCGAAGEPCDPQNRPYFRVGNSVTRGQLSKMVSEAFGFNEVIRDQTFEDVPSDNAFYLFIERMARRNIISGYTCGRPTEPCLPPDNRPYFRPNDLVNRGQTAKIVDGARLQPTRTPTPVPTATRTSTPTSTSMPTSTSAPTSTSEATVEPTITATSTIGTLNSIK